MMKKVLAAFLALALATSLLFATPVFANDTVPEDITLETADASYSRDVSGFVTRLYAICLDRKPDTNGLNDWVNKLKSRQISGAEAAHGFIFSNEFKKKNLCNEDYVRYLYRAFFDREADAGGFNDWVGKLNSGATRGAIFNGFIGSQEFGKLCASYGINRGDGDYSNENFTQNGNCSACGKQSGTVGFVTRLYSVCLDRTPDAGGLNDWVSKLNNHEISGAQAAYGFIFSNEFKNKQYCNSHFVQYLYKAFMGREYDQGGLNDWVGRLNGGASRESVFNGFSQSNEFKRICASYGITVGDSVNGGDTRVNGNGNCAACKSGSKPAVTPAPAAPAPTAAPVAPAPTAAPAVPLSISESNLISILKETYSSSSLDYVDNTRTHGYTYFKAANESELLTLQDNLFDCHGDGHKYLWENTVKVCETKNFSSLSELKGFIFNFNISPVQTQTLEGVTVSVSSGTYAYIDNGNGNFSLYCVSCRYV